MKIPHRTSCFAAIFTATQLAAVLAWSNAFAGSATWNAHVNQGFWNVRSNWTPATIPNSASDTATFASSDATYIQTLADTEVNSIVFNEGASAYLISAGGPNADVNLILTISGAGVTNNSGVTQNFVSVRYQGEIQLTNNASAGGSDVVFTNDTGTFSLVGGTKFFDTATAGAATFVNNSLLNGAGATTEFFDNSSAGNGTFLNNAPAVLPNSGGATIFHDSSTAANGTFTNQPGAGVSFFDSSTAGNGTFVNVGPTSTNPEPGATGFAGSSTAENAMITNEGGTGGSGFSGGVTTFFGGATAGSATIINEAATTSGIGGGEAFLYDGGDGGEATIVNNGASVDGALGGFTIFSVSSTASDSTLIANNGIGTYGGGVIYFNYDAKGGRARVEVFGNGKLSCGTTVPLTIGSIEGDGLVEMQSDTSIGSNNLNTTFRGHISGAGRLTKIGTGTLILTNTNSYHGGTTIERGKLVIGNTVRSGTGDKVVSVNGGVLAGTGTIAGPVTVGDGAGSGALLMPGSSENPPSSLTIQDRVSFLADATLRIRLDSDSGRSGAVTASSVTINGAQFSVIDDGSSSLPSGTVITAINNTAATPISGAFGNLPDGSTITAGANTYQASYTSGDGNDLTLTVVP